MGSPDKLLQADRNQKPQHRVRLTKAFYMGVYEVTRGEFSKFVEDTNYITDAEKDGKGKGAEGSNSPFGALHMLRPEYNWRNPGLNGHKQTDDEPVVDVSWNDANAFCAWLSQKEKKTYRLPTEAEWEYACRAGTTSVFHFGDTLDGTEAACNGEMSYGLGGKQGTRAKSTVPVGSYTPNAFGLHDMHGNVTEWCSDFYQEDFFAKSPPVDPKGPAKGHDRVMRGGSWTSQGFRCIAASRGSAKPEDRSYARGFRVVLNP
jgi:formylglycine-generating enzyme required for sulfatase activity